MAKEKSGFNLGKAIESILNVPMPYVAGVASRGENIDPRVLANSDPRSYICEQYRKLVTVLRFVTSERGVKSIVIASAVRNEGKTVTISNVASLFCNYDDKKVLLIDGDVRKPTLHRVFNMPRKPGLTDILTKKAGFTEVVRKTKGFSGLDIIPAGSETASPVELFSSATFKNLIEERKEEYDYLFIDSAPLTAVTDACVLARVMDGVIVGVRAESTPEPILREALALLEDVKANILGLVMTHARIETRYYTYYRYYRKYHPHYYEYAKKDEEEKRP